MASNMLTAIVDSILPSKPQPVVPDGQLLKAMDISFMALILTLAGLAFITSANPHVLALILVAICLWLSVRWFVAELTRVNHINKPVCITDDIRIEKTQEGGPISATAPFESQLAKETSKHKTE